VIKAVLFDLDDTLYLERDYVHGAFLRVADEVESLGFRAACALDSYFMSVWDHEGRDRVLDKAADRLGFPAEWVPRLVDAFRDHDPDIRLFPEVRTVIERLRADYRLALITDGHAKVQRRKIRKLELDSMIDCIIIADDYGRSHWKPDPLPFATACSKLGVSPGEAVMVGDNPERDVRGAKGLKMKSVRLRRPLGYFFTLEAAPEDEPDHEISDLLGLLSLLERL